MSKLLYISKRENSKDKEELKILKAICQQVTPDNLKPNPPFISGKDGIYIGILNPKSVLRENNSVCLGNLLNDGRHHQWFQPQTAIPDGTFALFRANAQYIELASDATGSRTIWYFHSDDLFIASTSQRMIISYLRDFKPNKKVYSWVLSTGSLGPGNSWDERIKPLPGNSKLVLDRSSWTIKLEIKAPRFDAIESSLSEHFERLKAAIEFTFKQLHLNYSQWVLPLSGGYDSRAILMHLPNKNDIKTITWGLSSSVKEKDTDAYVAKQVSSHYGCSNKYYVTDISKKESIEVIFDRFLKTGEGRIDHISGYLDGFTLWNTLHKDGIAGIIRGDEGFGWVLCKTEKQARRQLGMALLSDYQNLENRYKEWEVETNTLPDSFRRNENETVATWRDRLYHQFRIPVVLAALNDLKLSHVEIINPLLSHLIIKEVRKLPDELRTRKMLFKQIVDSKGPNINYAKQGSNQNLKGFLKNDEAIRVIEEELRNSSVLSDKLTQSLIPEMQLKRVQTGENVDLNLISFRAFIISRMDSILKGDARFLRK